MTFRIYIIWALGTLILGHNGGHVFHLNNLALSSSICKDKFDLWFRRRTWQYKFHPSFGRREIHTEHGIPHSFWMVYIQNLDVRDLWYTLEKLLRYYWPISDGAFAGMQIITYSL